MPEIIACPSCGGKLRISEELHGQKVRCPECKHIFDSAGQPQPPSAPFGALQDLPLELTLDEPSSPPPAPSLGIPGLVGAIELSPSSQSPPPEPPLKSPPRLFGKERDPDMPDLRRSGPRRSTEPDRGAIVLSLGIISLALIVIWCAAPVGAILGLAAWIMGQIDLRKMKRGQMDDQNRGMTQAGWICGILGTFLNVLMMLGCGMFIGVMFFSEMDRPRHRQPIPTPQPVQPMPRKGGMPPFPNNPQRDNF